MNDLLRLTSNIFDKTTEKTIGAVGYCNFFMTCPNTPKINITITPYIEFVVLYEPTTHTIDITGIIKDIGTDRILTIKGIIPNETNKAIIFVKKREAIKPHVKSG